MKTSSWLHDIYDYAIDAGIERSEFWGSSPNEISEKLQSFERKEFQRRKETVMDLFVLAEIISRYVWADEDSSIPHPWDYYGDLFKKEKEIFEQDKKFREMENYKEKRRAYAKALNERHQQNQNT